MATREEIRAGIERAICGGMLVDSELFMEDGYYFLTDKFRTELAMRVLHWLHSQGVVIKVDRAKSPDDLVAVEPLIEEK